MQSPAPAHGKYALRTGRVLDKPVAILEFSRLGATPPPLGDIEEVSAEALVDDTEQMATPAPPVIAKIVRTTQIEAPPPLPARSRRTTRARGPSVFAMFATVILLAAVGAAAGFGMRALARPPVVGASAAMSAGGVGAVGDREQRDHHAARIPSTAPIPPTLAAPPAPESMPAKAVGAAAPPRVTKAQPAAHGVHAAHAPKRPATAPAARGAKKRGPHDR